MRPEHGVETVQSKYMGKVYTRSGDRGMTGLHGGGRVAKDDPRIEANGDLDELNCRLGVVRTLLGRDDAWQGWCAELQRVLMEVMSHVATPSALRERNPNPLPEGMDRRCEELIDALQAETVDNGWFVLPGGTPLAAQLQLARAVARRAERRLWTLHRLDPLPECILRFVNRLSDLLFVMARVELQRQGWPEERWREFSYKRKKRNDDE